MIWFLGIYMWLFIHRPFEVWPALGDLRIERIYMLAMLAYWAFAGDKQWISNRLNPAFAFFCLVLVAAWIASPFFAQGSSAVEDYLKIAVFYVLVMSTVRTEKDLKLLVIMFMGAMAVYMVDSLREYINGRHVYRMGTARMVGVDLTNGDPNSFAATILYSLPILFPLWFECRNPRLRWLLLGYALLAVTCISLTGSRSGFFGLCVLAVVASLLSKHRVAVLLMLALAAPVVWTLLPQDRQNRYLTLIDPSYGPKNAQESAEGRAKGWRDGLKLWQENPVLGIGPGVFGQATGTGMQSHQLYGQVLGELGTLGAIAFALIVFCFARNHLDQRAICREDGKTSDNFPSRLIQAISIVVFLLLVMGFSGHNLYRYTWLWFGAFDAIALQCLIRPVEEPVEESWTS